jgi:hypothetical protein
VLRKSRASAPWVMSRGAAELYLKFGGREGISVGDVWTGGIVWAAIAGVLLMCECHKEYLAIQSSVVVRPHLAGLWRRGIQMMRLVRSTLKSDFVVFTFKFSLAMDFLSQSS